MFEGSNPGMMFKRQPDMLKAYGRIESLKHDLKLLESKLDLASLWLPGISLKKQCNQAARMIDNIAERFDRKLVVTIIGPSGSGKSTLLNALAEVDELSPVGHQRPTTENLIVFSNDHEDARLLSESMGGDSVEIRSSRQAVFPEHVILIDSPDTDSTALQRHIPILRRAISHSDMLICVFDAENPKRRDHVDFLARFIRRFSGESLVVVMNKCDRLDEDELKKNIIPDFARYIAAAWQIGADSVLSVSARRHLENPKWDESASPRHEFDQFDDLRELVFGTINQAAYVVDRRLENARSLRDFVLVEVKQETAKKKAALDSAHRLLREAEKGALITAAAAMKEDDTRQFFGVNVMVYQKLSQMWLGPVGWMIAIWARLLVFGTGILSMLRFGRPFQQLYGVISALRRFKDTTSATEESYSVQRVDVALRNYRLAIMKSWPDIAELLVNAGFESSVRRVEDALEAGGDFAENLSAIWSQALDQEIERATRKLSGFIIQLFFNAPGIAVLGYTGWLTVRGFFSGSYLTGAFFLHAFWAILIILLFSFFLLQACVRLVARADRLNTRAFEKLRHDIEQVEGVIMNPVRSQLEVVRGLAESLHLA
jgi:energy-coupling factor transporter ATP-binding protein EcfA2